MSPRAHGTSLVWLCLLIYALGGTLRTGGLALCIGEGRVQLAFVGGVGGCSCCTDTADAPGDARGGEAVRSHGCSCVDVALPFDRDDRTPQHPGGAAKPPLPAAPVAWLPGAPVQAPEPAPRRAGAVHVHGPPWSAQAPLLLRRTVLLLL